MQCLIDGDLITYEIGFAGAAAWKYLNPDQTVEWYAENPPPFDVVEEQLLNRIAHIETICQSTEPSIFFFTGKTNFRNLIAKKQPYKVRGENKPYHYYNIKAYIKGKYECRQSEGLEADDLMAIHQKSRIEQRDTVICTRDKDLFQVSGYVFSWELGESPQFGPHFVEGYGEIRFDLKTKKIKGWGMKFFLSQCITGDIVDSVPGLAGKGPKAALKALEATTTYEEGLEAVLAAYEAYYEHPVIARDELLEQGQLLYMTRQLNEDGTPVLWEF